jgi:hypothetical protein
LVFGEISSKNGNFHPNYCDCLNHLTHEINPMKCTWNFSTFLMKNNNIKFLKLMTWKRCFRVPCYYMIRVFKILKFI